MAVDRSYLTLALILVAFVGIIFIAWRFNSTPVKPRLVKVASVAVAVVLLLMGLPGKATPFLTVSKTIFAFCLPNGDFAKMPAANN